MRCGCFPDWTRPDGPVEIVALVPGRLQGKIKPGADRMHQIEIESLADPAVMMSKGGSGYADATIVLRPGDVLVALDQWGAATNGG